MKESASMEITSKGKIQSFTDLIVWQEGHKLVLTLYKETRFFPKEETYGLTNQLRRSAVSLTSNIAEGFGRKKMADRLRFYHIAQGSLMELQNQFLIARDVGYLDKRSFLRLANQSISVQKLLSRLVKASEQRISNPSTPNS